jgi:predicted nucleotidyltransferase
MNQPPDQPLPERPRPSATRDDILWILLGAAVTAAVAGSAAYAIGRRRSRVRLPPHSALAPLALKDIAEKAGVKPPTALVHLGKLQDEGKVERVETDAGPRYALRPFVRCEWVDPDHGINAAWQWSGPVDWRFPLVSRVPDGDAQAFLVEWLDRAQARGLLPPMLSRFEESAPRPPLLQVVVYGSCARGDAHAKSDLDVLLFGTLPGRDAAALADLAHEIALRGGRTPDVRILDPAGWDAATPAFREAVQRDGKAVFFNGVGTDLLERHARAGDG